MVNEAMRTRQRPKLSWIEEIKNNILMLHFTKKMTLNRAEWKKRIDVDNSRKLG